MNQDMTCQGMQYKIGSTYHVDGDIALCRNGLHFCKNLSDVMNYYDRDYGSRYFEIVAKEPIISDDKKSVTAELRVIRELTDIEVNRAVYGDSDGYGYGYDYGYSDGNGYGYGYSCSCGGRDGDGFGHGDGNGDIDGNGYGNGYGYSDGNGCGYGYGYGGCDGNGYGDGYDKNPEIIMILNE